MRICPQCGAETTALTCRNDGFGTVDAGRYRRLDPSHLLGTLFQDRYRIDAVLGSGGMGSVYRATQVRVGRQVALKVINAELAYDLAVVARFQREGRAIASLIHPNIVQVYDFGQTDEGELFMAMELVHGRTLGEVLREEAPLDPLRVVQIGAQFFDALAEAHEHGVIHRDLKPENIFITETGRRRDVVKILDFGVAKIVNEPKSESMVTARGAILGSPKYMAPEQARGKGVTGHADLYAAGGILYEALTGHAVFNEPSPADYLVAHSVKMPSPPAVNGRELRGPLIDLVMKCLEKKPWNRPDGAGRALEAIEAARLAPVIEPGDNAPVVVREIPSDQDEAPRRLVRPPTAPETRADTLDYEGTPASAVVGETSPPPIPQSAPTTPVNRAALRLEVDTPTMASAPAMASTVAPVIVERDDDYDYDDEGDERARVVAAGMVRVERETTAPPTPQPIAAIDTRRLGGHEHLTGSRVAVQTDPTIIAAAQTSESLNAVHVVVTEERQRTGGLWMLAALLLLFVGGFVYLAANDFFRGGDSRGGERTASAADLRHAVEDPIQTSRIDPARPGPGVAVAASSNGPNPGEAHGVGTPEPGPVGELGEATAVASATGDDAPANGASAAAAAGVSAGTAPTVGATAPDDSPEAVQPATVDAAKADDAPLAKEQPAAPETAIAAGSAKPVNTAKVAKTPRTPAERTPVTRRAATPAPVADPLADLEDPDFPERPTKSANNIHQVLVDSTPSGAEIKMGALPLGRTPQRVEWKDLGQPVKVVLTKEGYQPHHVTLSADQTRLSVPLKPVMMQAPNDTP